MDELLKGRRVKQLGPVEGTRRVQPETHEVPQRILGAIECH
jgi:hypothetical protein